MINYIKLFSGDALHIVPELTKECAENSTWYIFSDFIRANISQDMIKASYLLVLDSYNKSSFLESKDKDAYEKHCLHMDILWQALTDENCAKLELHIRK